MNRLLASFISRLTRLLRILLCKDEVAFPSGPYSWIVDLGVLD